ncbi:hypothetical protein RZS08_53400, partial [Arthrospira platensis SPKY1]|nr:hypothetical protein [Arthrospira platensis SPKY1]
GEAERQHDGRDEWFHGIFSLWLSFSRDPGCAGFCMPGRTAAQHFFRAALTFGLHSGRQAIT